MRGVEASELLRTTGGVDRLPFAVGLARRASGIIRQNLFIALGVIGVLIVTTLSGSARIGTAVVLHEGSTLVVLANALRLLRYRQNPGVGERTAG